MNIDTKSIPKWQVWSSIGSTTKEHFQDQQKLVATNFGAADNLSLLNEEKDPEYFMSTKFSDGYMVGLRDYSEYFPNQEIKEENIARLKKYLSKPERCLVLHSSKAQDSNEIINQRILDIDGIFNEAPYWTRQKWQLIRNYTHLYGYYKQQIDMAMTAINIKSDVGDFNPE